MPLAAIPKGMLEDASIVVRDVRVILAVQSNRRAITNPADSRMKRVDDLNLPTVTFRLSEFHVLSIFIADARSPVLPESQSVTHSHVIDVVGAAPEIDSL